eukprot:TRINITY_DN1360_c0_g1_i1.p1 TRINITY_DN1360_c0_g1~~TRINITY_DN1360_c0_g1_i1.p1  ORF type:complete len:118 (+),score=11.54 TRINITY_DN1360_c0_g1_i1:179-532(+)
MSLVLLLDVVLGLVLAQVPIINSLGAGTTLGGLDLLARLGGIDDEVSNQTDDRNDQEVGEDPADIKRYQTVRIKLSFKQNPHREKPRNRTVIKNQKSFAYLRMSKVEGASMNSMVPL